MWVREAVLMTVPVPRRGGSVSVDQGVSPAFLMLIRAGRRWRERALTHPETGWWAHDPWPFSLSSSC